jgi:hypothetical protein
MLKNTFLNKMKGATVMNNRSRIARHCSHFKTEALLSWREVGMESQYHHWNSNKRLPA